MKKSFYKYSQSKNFDNEFKYKTENIQTDFNKQKSDFEKNKQNTSNRQKQNNNASFNQGKIEETINKYKNMSQSDLLTNLYSEVSKQKMQGTFDPIKLENAILSLGSFLTPQQQNNMKELLRKLK